MKAIWHKIYSLLSFRAAQPVKPKRRWSRLLHMLLGVLLFNAVALLFSLCAPVSAHASSSSTHATVSVQASHSYLHRAGAALSLVPDPKKAADAPPCADPTTGTFDQSCIDDLNTNCGIDPASKVPYDPANGPYLGGSTYDERCKSWYALTPLDCINQVTGNFDVICAVNLKNMCFIQNPTDNKLLGLYEMYQNKCQEWNGLQDDCRQQATSGAAPPADCFNPPGTYAPAPDGKGQTKFQSPFIGTMILFYTPLELTIGSSQVQILSHIVLVIVDSFMVFIIVITGFRVIVAGSTFRFANTIESLPGVLIAIVGSQFSMVIVSFFIVLGNVLSVTFYTMADYNPSLQPTANNVQTQAVSPNSFCVDSDGTIFGPCTFVDNIFGTSSAGKKAAPVNLSIVPTNLDFGNFFDNITDLFHITDLMVKVLADMLLAQKIIQWLFMSGYAIFASAALAAGALPGGIGAPATRLWFQGFISVVMVTVLQAAALILAQLMMGAITTYLYAPLFGHGQLTAETLGNIMRVSVLWFVLRIPSLLGTAPMRSMVEAGQAMQQAAVAQIGVSVAEVQLGVQAAGGLLQGGIGAGAMAA